MGISLYELKRFEEALEQYILAIHYDPSFSNAYYNMGIALVLYELKRNEEAIEQYNSLFNIVEKKWSFLLDKRGTIIG